MLGWVTSAALSFALGGLLVSVDRKRRGGRPVDPRRLTGLQVVSTLLLAYPFILAYVFIDQRLR